LANAELHSRNGYENARRSGALAAAAAEVIQHIGALPQGRSQQRQL
jgi:hypothetical protein